MKAELSNQKEVNEDIENGICSILDLVYTRSKLYKRPLTVFQTVENLKLYVKCIHKWSDWLLKKRVQKVKWNLTHFFMVKWIKLFPKGEPEFRFKVFYFRWN